MSIGCLPRLYGTPQKEGMGKSVQWQELVSKLYRAMAKSIWCLLGMGNSHGPIRGMLVRSGDVSTWQNLRNTARSFRVTP